MLEHEDVILRDMTLENPIRAIREISHDTSCRRPVRLASGRELSALDIQRELLEKAMEFDAKVGFPALEKDPFSLDREIDWVIKHRLIESYASRHGLGLADPQVQLIDLQYHDINTDRGVFYKAQRRGLVDRMCSDEDILRAMDEPPQTTRARLRGEFVRQAKLKKRDFTVDWVHLKLNDQAQRTVLCKDPFKSRDERVERLIAGL
jgi:proteasome accessory factor A